ncbi:MAG: (Fe-S)-binding protein [Desulfobacteraceae bacterium]|nr:(Fe-S)-binding protein [Desulfobacteraceae bacterium]
MIELIQMMKTLDQAVARCSRCGMCQAVCPLYIVTKNESDVARGKLMLLDGLMRSFFEDPKGVLQRLDRCLLCGSCAANCPRGVNTLEIFLNARIIISGYSRMPLVKKIIFRYLLSNPELFDRIISWASKWQYLFFIKTEFQLDASCAALISPLLSKRRMVPLAPVPFHKISPKIDPALKPKLKPKLKPERRKTEKKSGLKVAFFVGCLLDKVFPKIATDIVRILNYHEISVFIPSSQGCCGIPALSSGDQVTFNRLVAHSLDQFDPSGFDYLVTGCATCTATIKKFWPSMYKPASEDQGAAVHRIAEKTYDINQFLVDVLGVKKSDKAEQNAARPIITYHDPCHLRKTLNVHSEPRLVIQANNAYSFKEMPDADTCCGMGGSFNLAHYGLSTDIGKKKVANIESTGAAVVATGCPACMIQLVDMLAREKKQIRVAHTIEIYSEKILSAIPSGAI